MNISGELTLAIQSNLADLASKGSLVPRPSSLVGKNKGEEGLVELIT